MKNMFKVDVDILDQKIVYRETIRAKVSKGRHKKQSGGAGQLVMFGLDLNLQKKILYLLKKS